MLAKEAIFHKYEACGNDYLVIPAKQTWFDATPDLIKKICSEQRGVGSDGILLHQEDGSDDPGVRVFNPDGGEAERSGNGVRIFARYLLDHGLWDGQEALVKTQGGDCLIRDEKDGSLSVKMGKASFEPSDIPLNDLEPWVQKSFEVNGETFSAICLSVGNPHCVLHLDQLPSDEFVKKHGPVIENYPSFPNRINVQFARVVDRKNIEMKIWERGAGLTLSSGSSSSAAAFAFYSLDLVDQEVNVNMEGGSIKISILEDEIWLRGPVNHIFTGTLSSEFLLH